MWDRFFNQDRYTTTCSTIHTLRVDMIRQIFSEFYYVIWFKIGFLATEKRWVIFFFTSSMFSLKPLQFQFIIFGLNTLVYFEMELRHQGPSLVLEVIGQVHYMHCSQQEGFESTFADGQF